MTTARHSLPRNAELLLRWLLIALCVLMLVLSGRMVLAAAAAHQAEQFILDWHAKNEVPSERAWQVAHAAAQRAINLYPAHHGDYYDRLGRIYEWQQLDQPYGAPEATDSRTAALRAYRQSLQYRPTQPYTWAQVAYIKLRLWQIDDEFMQALRKAHESAPWQHRASARVAEVGLITWPLLAGTEQEMVLEATARATAGRRQHSLFTLAGQVGVADMLCRRLADNARTVPDICKS